MQLTVHLFARLRDLVDSDIVSLELGESPTIADLRSRMMVQYPIVASILPRCLIALNQEFAQDHETITPGSELAIIPPVSGGSS